MKARVALLWDNGTYTEEDVDIPPVCCPEHALQHIYETFHFDHQDPKVKRKMIFLISLEAPEPDPFDTLGPGSVTH